MKRLIYLSLTILLAMSLSACCGFHRKVPCGPGHHAPCAVNKPCNVEAGVPCHKPCMVEGVKPEAKPCPHQ